MPEYINHINQYVLYAEEALKLQRLETAFHIYVYFLVFVIGAVCGSYINCVAWRYVHKEGSVHGRSHCATCGHELSFKDEVPILSYALLRGRCRYCGEKISPRYVIAEIVMGSAFTAVSVVGGLSLVTARNLPLLVLLMLVVLVYIDTHTAPGKFVAAGLVWWAIWIPFTGDKSTIIIRVAVTAVVAAVLGVIYAVLAAKKGKKGRTE